jgi:hypothetical protein
VWRTRRRHDRRTCVWLLGQRSSTLDSSVQRTRRRHDQRTCVWLLGHKRSTPGALRSAPRPTRIGARHFAWRIGARHYVGTRLFAQCMSPTSRCCATREQRHRAASAVLSRWRASSRLSTSTSTVKYHAVFIKLGGESMKLVGTDYNLSESQDGSPAERTPTSTSTSNDNRAVSAMLSRRRANSRLSRQHSRSHLQRSLLGGRYINPQRSLLGWRYINHKLPISRCCAQLLRAATTVAVTSWVKLFGFRVTAQHPDLPEACCWVLRVHNATT